MAAVVGDPRNRSRTGMGMFRPGSPFASDAGVAILNGKRDPALARKLIGESGYRGEEVVLMIPEVPEYRAMGEVSAAVGPDAPAYRTGLAGFLRAPITALWNVRRT
jgi:peptide/nickel transport system substrate-binding protein